MTYSLINNIQTKVQPSSQISKNYENNNQAFNDLCPGCGRMTYSHIKDVQNDIQNQNCENINQTESICPEYDKIDGNQIKNDQAYNLISQEYIDINQTEKLCPDCDMADNQIKNDKANILNSQECENITQKENLCPDCDKVDNQINNDQANILNIQEYENMNQIENQKSQNDVNIDSKKEEYL